MRPLVPIKDNALLRFPASSMEVPHEDASATEVGIGTIMEDVDVVPSRLSVFRDNEYCFLP